MRKYALPVIAISLFILSCKEETLKISKVNSSQNLGNGEWLDSTDTVNGISVRENKIAFFKKMEFNSHDISKYQIIDSIYKNGKSEKKVGEYLLIEKDSGRLTYRIVKRNKRNILLEDSKKNLKTYKFWR